MRTLTKGLTGNLTRNWQVSNCGASGHPATTSCVINHHSRGVTHFTTCAGDRELPPECSNRLPVTYLLHRHLDGLALHTTSENAISFTTVKETYSRRSADFHEARTRNTSLRADVV
jgi:hypothetical protein